MFRNCHIGDYGAKRGVRAKGNRGLNYRDTEDTEKHGRAYLTPQPPLQALERGEKQKICTTK
jgi:hypothetical protein